MFVIHRAIFGLQCFETSSPSGLNDAVLVGTEDGNVEVPGYDWAEFLSEYYDPIIGIKSSHQFIFSKDKKGTVYSLENIVATTDCKLFHLTILYISGVVMCRQYCNSLESTEKTMKKKVVSADSFPSIMPVPGIPLARGQYLFKEIREYCKEEFMDLVCPKPISVAPAASNKKRQQKPKGKDVNHNLK